MFFIGSNNRLCLQKNFCGSYKCVVFLHCILEKLVSCINNPKILLSRYYRFISITMVDRVSIKLQYLGGDFHWYSDVLCLPIVLVQCVIHFQNREVFVQTSVIV